MSDCCPSSLVRTDNCGCCDFTEDSSDPTDEGQCSPLSIPAVCVPEQVLLWDIPYALQFDASGNPLFTPL